MNECCEDMENRADGPGERGGDYPDELQVTHCTVCGCRHFEAEAEPGEMGLLGGAL
jgi:hypothetical protein